MIINVVENEINMRLSNYLGVIEVLHQLILAYQSYKISFQDFILITKSICDEYDIKINDLYYQIINILNHFTRMRIIYTNKKSLYIIRSYRYIIRNYNKKKEIIKLFIDMNILKKNNINEPHIINAIMDYYM